MLSLAIRTIANTTAFVCVIEVDEQPGMGDGRRVSAKEQVIHSSGKTRTLVRSDVCTHVNSVGGLKFFSHALRSPSCFCFPLDHHHHTSRSRRRPPSPAPSTLPTTSRTRRPRHFHDPFTSSTHAFRLGCLLSYLHPRPHFLRQHARFSVFSSQHPRSHVVIINTTATYHQCT